MTDQGTDTRAQDEARAGGAPAPGAAGAGAGKKRTGSESRGTQNAGPESRGTPKTGSESQGTRVYPAPVQRLIEEFAKLPGVGRRSAERLAFHILKAAPGEALGLAQAVRDVKEHVRHCAVCFNLSDGDRCAICEDPRREHATVLVVEQPKDLIALEQTGMWRGVYHVLMGRISPLEGIGPGDLTVAALLRRVEHPEGNAGGVAITEVVLGLNPTVEGDGTGLFLAEELRRRGLRVTRLARGLPSGGQLEYANKAVLADAVQHRQSME
ncbi:MAG: recombination mediator RecR [Phycisphaerales bacterium]